MAAEDVERLVTFPIETAVNGASDVRRVRSASSLGFSFVWVEFDWGTDVYKARQVVSEKLVTITGQLPMGVSAPGLAPQSSVMGEILFVGLQADSTNMMDLRTAILLMLLVMRIRKFPPHFLHSFPRYDVVRLIGKHFGLVSFVPHHPSAI